MISLLSSFQFAKFLLLLMKLMCLGAPGYALINVCLWPSKVAAAIVWGTIDDQLGDSVTHRLVNYYPTQNVWANQTCGGNKCTVVPDKSQAFDNTYTAGKYDPAEKISIGINMQFTGTAIYVFFILGTFTPPYPPTLNSANFTLDSNEPVLFTSKAIGIQYHVPVFYQTNLSHTLHTLNITTSGPVGPIYVNFDYALYSYDDDVLTTTSSLSSLPTVTITSQAPSMTVTGAPALKTPVGAIVGSIAGGITLLALVLFLLFCWHRRRGHDAPQSVRERGGLKPLVTQFNAVSASGMPYTQPIAVRSKSARATVTVSGDESSNTDNQENMGNKALHSGEVVLSPSGYQQLPPSSEKASSSSTSNSSVFATSSDNRSASPLLPSPLNVAGAREEVRRARQEDLHNRLRVVQQNIVQLEESSAGPGRSVSLRRQTSGEAEIIEEEMHMSVPDMQEAIRSMREQIRVLREQQQSAWALGLSDDPPPGYTPMDVGMHISREASS